MTESSLAFTPSWPIFCNVLQLPNWIWVTLLVSFKLAFVESDFMWLIFSIMFSYISLLGAKLFHNSSGVWQFWQDCSICFSSSDELICWWSLMLWLGSKHIVIEGASSKAFDLSVDVFIIMPSSRYFFKAGFPKRITKVTNRAKTYKHLVNKYEYLKSMFSQVLHFKTVLCSSKFALFV